MEEHNPSPFGALLRRFRVEAGLSQEELAERALISARAISDLERGVNRTARRDTVRRLIEALDLSPEQRTEMEVASRPPRQGIEPAEPAAGSQLSHLHTFLIADIRGYTRFTEERGDEAGAELAAHFARLVGQTVTPRQGRLLELRGDEALVVFSSARQALRAAVELQTRCEEDWGQTLPLHIGIGLDAGEAVPAQRGYRGRALNLAARLCDLAGRGAAGQSEVFCSETVISLAGTMEGVAWVDRGAVRLKGLADPVRVLQVGEEGDLPATPPPLQSASIEHVTTLPNEPTPFIGREQEVAAVVELLLRESVRLLTLTGPGGTGKTRLAIRVAQELPDAFSDGVVFVPMAPLSDPALVPSAIAVALGLKETPAQSLLDALQAYLCDKHLLLLLDNFEHLLPAASLLSQLLAACPGLTVLVTSRAVLDLLAEHVYAVSPLAVPTAGPPPAYETLIGYDAIALFVERAQAAKAGFSFTEENAAAVVEICRRLDGLPLAIELAAARIRLFPPSALLRRLSNRLQLLSGGSRDRPNRQQTLWNAIDWSYSLLTDDEQLLFRRLSVFAGGCTLEAAEAVCDPDGVLDVLEGLTSLIDQSLLRQGGEEEPRFLMLETIREYAWKRLEECEDAETVRALHAAHFTELAEQLERVPSLATTGTHPRPSALSVVEQEHDNFAAALAWTVQRHDVTLGLRLAGALRQPWTNLGRGRSDLWPSLQALLPYAAQVPPIVRAKALIAAGVVGMDSPASEPSEQMYAEAMAIYREVGDTYDVLDLLLLMAGVKTYSDWTLNPHRLEQAEALYKESLALARELRVPRAVGAALRGLGDVVGRLRNDHEQARLLLEESLTVEKAAENPIGVAHSLHSLAWEALLEGAAERASTLARQAVLLYEQTGNQTEKETARFLLGLSLLQQGDCHGVREASREALANPWVRRYYNADLWLVALAACAAAERRSVQAARLFGVALSSLEPGRDVPNLVLSIVQPYMDKARTDLGVKSWGQAWEAGRAMNREEAVARALDESSYAGRPIP